MTLGSRIRSWFRATVGRSRMEREMDVELRFHIEAYAEDLARGASGPDGGAAVRMIAGRHWQREKLKERNRILRGWSSAELDGINCQTGLESRSSSGFCTDINSLLPCVRLLPGEGHLRSDRRRKERRPSIAGSPGRVTTSWLEKQGRRPTADPSACVGHARAFRGMGWARAGRAESRPESRLD